MGPKGPTVAAEGCSPPQELEKAARRAAIFLVLIKTPSLHYYFTATNPDLYSVHKALPVPTLVPGPLQEELPHPGTVPQHHCLEGVHLGELEELAVTSH